MRTTTMCTLVASLILPAALTCYGRTASNKQSAVDPRWRELPHTDTEFVPPRYDSLDLWQKHREHLRKQILWAAGLWPMPAKTPLNAHISGRIEHDDYTVEKVYFESVPGLFVTGNLYRPGQTSLRSHPGVLNPHGHAATGRLHDNEVASYQARCITFARMGCVAFMWDMIEYNDSAMQLQGQYQEKTYWNVHNAPWKHKRDRRTLWNVNALGIQLWNSVRALDFLASLPEVDPKRLACTGESGGGTQTFLLAAVDKRVKVAAPVCMVSSYMQGGCNCENAPGLRIDTHNTEFAAIMAPRPMMLVSVTPLHAGDVSYEREGDCELAGLMGERGTLIERRRGIRIPMWIFQPRDQEKNSSSHCSLLLHGQGRFALAAKKALIKDLLAQGHVVYAVEVFGLGDARSDDPRAAQRGTSRYFMTFNRTDDAERVYDIVAALRFCQWHGPDGEPAESVSVSAFDKAGPWTIVAGALLGIPGPNEPPVRFAIDLDRFDTTSEARYLADLFVPGIQRAGGLANAAALIAPRPLLLHHTGDSFEALWVRSAYALKHTQSTRPRLNICKASQDDEVLLQFLSPVSKVHPATPDTNARIAVSEHGNVVKLNDTHTRTGAGYFPPPESQGGWRKLKAGDEIRRLTGMDPDKLDELKEWLLASDSLNRNFAAVVIRRGYVVLEIEKGISASTDPGRSSIASCSKAICATVLAVASKESQSGHFPKKMKFDDPAFQFIPWAQPLGDPRKAEIKVKQLLNHTSGIVGEWWQNKDRGVKNNGSWEWILGHAGDWRTEKLLFQPGTDLEYSTHGLFHASLVCEDVTGMPFDRFAIKDLFEPIGIETSKFHFLNGDEKHGRHPSHFLGLPAREMARIAYCMLRNGRWGSRQVIPKWFVKETGVPTHDIKGTRTFGREAQTFSHGWELPARLTGGLGDGIPMDARFKPGTGCQLIAFVPSLDLVLVRMTGSAGGEYDFEKPLRLACAAVMQSHGAEPEESGFISLSDGKTFDN